METQRPRVGIGVMIFRNGKILLTRRKGSHGVGDFAFPGGHLEYGESFAECAIRETREEAGIEIENTRFQLLANVRDFLSLGKHYTHIGLIADWKSGEPQVLEPDKSEEWDWYSLDALPDPLFAGCKLAVVAYQTGQNYFDN